MKKVMKEIELFETADGRVFNTEFEAEVHERDLKQKETDKATNSNLREEVSKLLIIVEKVDIDNSTDEITDLLDDLKRFLKETDPDVKDDFNDSNCEWFTSNC